MAVVSEAEHTSDLLSTGAPISPARSARKREPNPSGVIEIELARAQVRVTGEVSLEALRLVLETLSK